MENISKPRALMLGAAVACVLAIALLTWAFWPSAPVIPGAERVRQYSNVRACLLTGADGVTGANAAAAWAGLQGASSSSRAMVSYLPVPAPASEATVLPYLASLVQRQCGVIVAVGPAQVAAARWAAPRYRHVHFIVITRGEARSAVQAAVIAAISG